MRGNDMRRTTTFAVIALLLAGLTACSPRPADPHPTAEPPTIESPGPAATSGPVTLIPESVRITAHSVSVGSTTEALIEEVPYTTDVAIAVDLLSEAIELEPTVSAIAGTECSAAATAWTWGGFRIVSPALRGDELGVNFMAQALGPETSNGLFTEFRHTDTVGATLADVIAHNAGSDDEVLSDDLGGGHEIAMLDRQDGDTWGVIIVVRDLRVTSFYAPGYFRSDDGLC
jgi:hypothetical protein